MEAGQLDGKGLDLIDAMVESADENYYKVWVDVSAQVMRTDVYRVDRRTGIRELWNSTYATEEVQAVPEAVPVET